VSFCILTRRQPIGGALTLYQFANALARRGHTVTVTHLTVGKQPAIRSLDELAWIDFADGIEHRFTTTDGALELPEADFICPPMEMPVDYGQPFDTVQGYGMMVSLAADDETIRYPCPKVCVSRWLLELARSLGVPAHQLDYIPNGVDHEKYRVLTPLEDRPLQVAMLYRNHPRKGPTYGLRALAEVKRRLPEARIVVFSQNPPVHEVPADAVLYTDAPQDVIVRDIYNQSRVFLCSSVSEGFGLMCVEAMACGAALVTTANGGSEEYAVPGETALVCEPKDVAAMADRVVELLTDDALRIGVAERGREYVQRFDWDSAGERLEGFLERYGADPSHYQQPAR
jgi:glycosyltransferase involved in cell wall biosynthesis